CTFARGRDATRPSGRMLWLGLRSRIGSSRMRRRAFLQIVMPPHALGRAGLAGMRGGLRPPVRARLRRRPEPEGRGAALAPLCGHDLADQPPVAMKQLAALRAYDATARLQEI